MTDWIIYYSDGSSFSSDDGGPGDAPRDGVQVIVNRDEGRCGRLFWHGSDFYCWQEGEWVPRNNDAGLFDYLRQPGTEKIVLQGRGIRYQAFIDIYNRAVEDKRLPQKDARDHREPPEPYQ